MVEIVSGLSCPVAITYRDGLLLIAELGKQQLVCSDFTGDHFLNPSKMTVKQLRKALRDRQLLQPGSKLKKDDLQKALKSWTDINSSNDGDRQTKLHNVEILNKPSIKPTAIVFSDEGTDRFCVAEISGEVHQISLTINGLKATAQVLRSIDVEVDNLFGIASAKRDCELYVSSSADSGGLFSINFETGHRECLLRNGSEDLQRIHGVCKKNDGMVIMVDRATRKLRSSKEIQMKLQFWLDLEAVEPKMEVKQLLASLNQLRHAVKRVPIQFMC